MKKEEEKAPISHVGADARSVEQIRAAIMDILKSGAEQDTLRCALGVLKDASTVSNVTISNCTFNSK